MPVAADRAGAPRGLAMRLRRERGTTRARSMGPAQANAWGRWVHGHRQAC